MESHRSTAEQITILPPSLSRCDMEDQEEPQVQSAGGEQRPTTPVAAGAEIPEGGPNRTDPIPAFDSKTQEELNLERGTPGLQGVDSELYRAMMGRAIHPLAFCG